MYAPIVLFVYNRPDHTLKTLESLAQNQLIDESDLYIYADGAKEDSDDFNLAQIEKTRKVCRDFKSSKSLKLIEFDENKGLAKNITEGVTKIVNQRGMVIVLEDDLDLSKGFLKYMNDALSLYKETKQVMHISGYIPPVCKKLNETFFFGQTSCWGWATWKDSWADFNSNTLELYNAVLSTNQISRFNLDDSIDFLDHLKANIDGRLNTWAIKWHASVFLKNGLCLHPRVSLVKNIGFDGSGVHCDTSKFNYSNQIVIDEINVNKIELKESLKARRLIRKFNLKLKSKNKVGIIWRFLQLLKKKILS